MKVNYIRESIRRVVNCYGTSNPEELIHAMGIKLGYLPNDTDIDKLKGCYGMVDGEKVILIHPDLDDMERKVVCAHELNHGVCKIKCVFFHKMVIIKILNITI